MKFTANDAVSSPSEHAHATAQRWGFACFPCSSYDADLGILFSHLSETRAGSWPWADVHCVCADAGFDVDDVGAVCLANALQDNGETDIIAVGHTNGYVKGIGAVSALMQFYDRADVPLGS